MSSPIGEVAPAATPCSCHSGINQIMTEIQDKPAIDFETFLDVGTRFTRQCNIIISCDHCRAHYGVLTTLRPILERVLALYEAACAAYSFTRVDLDDTIVPGQGRCGGQLQFPEANPVFAESAERRVSSFCISQPAKITWGGLELKGEDAKLLVKVLIRRRLAALGNIMDELHEMLMALWEVSWPRQRTMLTACETSFSNLGERLDSLMGLLK